MAIIKPFKALRPQAQFARQVASPPYDVLTSAEAKIEAQGNPISFLHITKSEIDLSEDTDPYSNAVYERAKENLNVFIKRDILFRENKDCFYIYCLVMPDPQRPGEKHSQAGLVCVSSIDDYENNIIKKHEFTRPDKEQDRINHIKATGAQTGNVFLAYRNVAALDSLIDKCISEKSGIYDFTSNDGIQHTVWIVNDTDTINGITELFATSVPCTYIADGHHRAASAAKVKKELGKYATENAGYFLTTLVPANQLLIMDYNRLVKTMNGHDPESFLQLLNENFLVEEIGGDAYKPIQLHEFGLYLNSKWYKLTAREGSYSSDTLGVLDVTILQNNILGRLLNIHDQRTDEKIDFVGGIKGLEELSKRVDSGEMALAFSLYPVSIEQLFDIADVGNIMPPKSTWFEPKLRDGLLTHLIYE